MKIKRNVGFKYKPFSLKQKKLLTWWLPGSPYADSDMVIADGSIRSGKTVSMIVSFIEWSMNNFKDCAFIVAGRSVGALERNVIEPMKQILYANGYRFEYNRSKHYIVVSRGGRNGATNVYYCFGASTEASQDTLQGLTAAGALADEVALFPQSFVNQMIGRCSVEGSKIWLNCNPESPYHFVKTDLIDKAAEKNILHLHFTLDDNLSLSDKVKQRYHNMYSGVWYQRMILGEWRIADGIIYDMFSDDQNVYSDDGRPEYLYSSAMRYLTIDYGTSNPMVFLDIYDDGSTIWVDKEYYYSGRENGLQKTDAEYLEDMKEFVAGRLPDSVIIDPSAASYKVLLRKNGFLVREADNNVEDGIRMVAMLLHQRKLKVHESCKNTIREFQTYMWDDKAIERGEEKPIKQNDHAMDAIRYYVKTIIKPWRLEV